jgi:hypothetical protein
MRRWLELRLVRTVINERFKRMHDHATPNPKLVRSRDELLSDRFRELPPIQSGKKFNLSGFSAIIDDLDRDKIFLK